MDGTSMTSRERLLTAVAGGVPDRVPVAPFGLGRLDPAGELAQKLIETVDPIIDVSCCGDIFLGRSPAVRRTERSSVLTDLIETPNGPLIRRIRRTAETQATVEFPFRNLFDVERFLSIPYEEPAIDLGDYEEWRDRLGEEGLVNAGLPDGMCLPAEYFSPEDLCLAWADVPDLVERLVAIGHERIVATAERLCRAGVRGFRVVGAEYATTQLGPAGFERLVMRYDRELVQRIHDGGSIVFYHCHGPVMRYIEGLAAIDPDCLDPLEGPPWGDADLAEARRRAGPRPCFLGNLDDMEVIDKLDADTVCAIARERLRTAGRQGFILGGTTSGTYGERGARNFMAMVEVAEEASRWSESYR